MFFFFIVIFSSFVLLPKERKKRRNKPLLKFGIVPCNPIPSILAHNVQKILYHHNQPDSFAILAASVRLAASSLERILVT